MKIYLSDDEVNYQAECALEFMRRRGSFDFWARSKDFHKGDLERIKEAIKNKLIKEANYGNNF